MTTPAAPTAQSQLGLHGDPSATLFAFVGRLTQQKGADVLLAAAPALLSTRGGGSRQLVMLGTGGCLIIHFSRKYIGVGNYQHPTIVHSSTNVMMIGYYCYSKRIYNAIDTGGMWEECAIKQLHSAFPGRAVGVAAFDERLAHLIYAAADVLVVPSRFEPCGLVAQCGARYGAVPLVASTGGLQDLVTERVGYTIPPVGRADDPIAFRRAVDALLRSMLGAAAEHVAGPPYRAKQRACMQLDLSWGRPAVQWELMLQQVAEAGGLQRDGMKI